jgi:Leucine-rich repeat (LRR) protein
MKSEPKKMKYLLFLIILLFLSCTSKKENSNSVIITDKERDQVVLMPTVRGQVKKSEYAIVAESLILGGRPYVDSKGKLYRENEAEQIEILDCDFNTDAVVRWHSFDGIEQLVNLRSLSVDGKNLDTIDFTPLISLSNLEELIIRGNITHLPNMSTLEKLSSVYIRYSRLGSLEGIGAPNIRRIEIRNSGGIDSFVPLNNLLHLEELVISGSDSKIYKIADISNLPKLKCLQLFMYRTKIDLQSIEDLSALEELSIPWSEPFNFEGIRKLDKLERLTLNLTSSEPSLEFLRDLPNLRELVLNADVDIQSFTPREPRAYQVLDVRPIATLKNLRGLSCEDFIIKNVAVLDIFDTLSLYLAGSRLYDETEKSKHPLVLEYPVRE